MAVFHNPTTLEAIEVPGAGCARFWIDFEFGNELFPEVGANLDLLNPTIIDVAIEVFGTRFVQGCQWG